MPLKSSQKCCFWPFFKPLKKFTKMLFLVIFQTGNFWVRKTAKIAIFVNFLTARALAQRAAFYFNDLKRKIVTKWLQIGYKTVTPEMVTNW
jgi:hypothetical protein